jgi:hypothetical protein
MNTLAHLSDSAHLFADVKRLPEAMAVCQGHSCHSAISMGDQVSFQKAWFGLLNRTPSERQVEEDFCEALPFAKMGFEFWQNLTQLASTSSTSAQEPRSISWNIPPMWFMRNGKR